MYNQTGMNYQGSPYQFAQPKKPLAYTNPLTDDERRLLKQNTPQFSLALTPEEIARAKCTHRDPATRTLTIVEESDGTVRCTQCGAKFNIVEATPEQIAQVTSSFIDVLQCAKMYWVDMAPEIVTNYFQIIPLADKAPKLFETAQKTFVSDTGSTNVAPGFNGNINPWQMMNHFVNGGGMGMPAYGYQQPYPQYQQPMQQPSYMNQPAYDYNQQVGGNPIQQGVMPNGQQFTAYGTYQQPMQNMSDLQAENERLRAQLNQSAPAIADKQSETVATNKKYQV